MHKTASLNSYAAAFSLPIALALSLTACERPAPTPNPSQAPARQTEWPQVDRSTPDIALQSYWATRDALRKHTEQAAAEDAPNWTKLRRKLEAAMTPQLAKSFVDGEGNRIFETFSRDILEVKVESDSRAIAIAQIRNATPIPPSAEVSNFDEERRRKGDRYKYVLKKANDGWRVDEIWEWETYPYPSWKRSRPGDGKPHVPSLPYEGM